MPEPCRVAELLGQRYEPDALLLDLQFNCGAAVVKLRVQPK